MVKRGNLKKYWSGHWTFASALTSATSQTNLLYICEVSRPRAPKDSLAEFSVRVSLCLCSEGYLNLVRSGVGTATVRIWSGSGLQRKLEFRSCVGYGTYRNSIFHTIHQIVKPLQLTSISICQRTIYSRVELNYGTAEIGHYLESSISFAAELNCQFCEMSLA